jgi:hypothetical protein
MEMMRNKRKLSTLTALIENEADYAWNAIQEPDDQYDEVRIKRHLRKARNAVDEALKILESA